MVRALEDSGLTLADLDDIELIGGGLRVPKILDIISEVLNVSHSSLGELSVGNEDEPETEPR